MEPLAKPAEPSVKPTDDYVSFHAALSATSRGRAFLEEHARRQRALDTDVLLNSLGRLEGLVRESATAPRSDHVRGELAALLDALRSVRSEVDAVALAVQVAKIGSIITVVEERVEHVLGMIDSGPTAATLATPEPLTEALAEALAPLAAIAEAPVVQAIAPAAAVADTLEAPAVEAAAVDAPVHDTPVAEAAQFEAPAVEAPAPEASDLEAPAAEWVDAASETPVAFAPPLPETPLADTPDDVAAPMTDAAPAEDAHDAPALAETPWPETDAFAHETVALDPVAITIVTLEPDDDDAPRVAAELAPAEFDSAVTDAAAAPVVAVAAPGDVTPPMVAFAPQPALPDVAQQFAGDIAFADAPDAHAAEVIADTGGETALADVAFDALAPEPAGMHTAPDMPAAEAAPPLALTAVIEAAARQAETQAQTQHDEQPKEATVLKAGTIPPPAPFAGEDFAAGDAPMTRAPVKTVPSGELLTAILNLSDDERTALFT